MELATSIASSEPEQDEKEAAPHGRFKNGKPRRAPQKKRRSRAKAARQAVSRAPLPVAEPTQIDVVRGELEALAVQLDSQLEAVKAAIEALK